MKMLKLLIFVPLIASCTTENIDFFQYVNEAPIVDGRPEKLWDKIKPHDLYFYYGQEAEDSLDFKGTFKVLQHGEDIYFFVTVYDQIKYTHPKPTDKLDLKLWNPEDYDRVNLFFYPNNDGKDNFGVCLNYGLDSIFTFNVSPKDIEAVLTETPIGYNTEFRIPLKFFKKDIITFHLYITDHDKRFNKEGLDVYGMPKSKYGSGGQYRRNKNY